MLLRFAQSWQRDLCDSLRLPIDGDGPIIEIVIGDATNSTAVSHGLWRDGHGAVGGRVVVADPAHADPDALRIALAAVLVRGAIHRLAPPDGHPGDPPAWFVVGMAHAAERSKRVTAYDRTHAGWSRGRLPPAWDLCVSNSAVMTAEPFVAAQFAAWCAERPEAARRWRRLFEHLAAGGAWDPVRLTGIWTDQGDLNELDEQWDRWLVSRSSRVLEPGATPAGLPPRFRPQLLLFPGECGMPIDNAWMDGMTVREFTARRREPWADGVAASWSARLRGLAAGRDRSFQQAVALHAQVLESCRRRISERKLMAALDAAEMAWRELEARAAAGETMRDAPGSPPAGQQEAQQQKGL